MKKTIKTILIIIFFICFLGLFLRPRTAKADFDYSDLAYDMIDTYLTYTQASQNAILSQFYTYSFLSVAVREGGEITRTLNFNLVISGISDYSATAQRYTMHSGSYYYDSYDSYAFPHAISGSNCILYTDHIYIWSNNFYFDVEGYPNRNIILYCDLTDTYFTDYTDPSSLITRNLNILPPYNMGSITSRSGNFGDNVDAALALVTPAPVVTTFPPFSPPATVPSFFLPLETVTVLPAVTDDSNNYYVDYSPYIDGNFYAPPTTDDIFLSPALSASGAIISEGFGWLTDSGVFSVLLVLMLVSFAICNLI